MAQLDDRRTDSNAGSDPDDWSLRAQLAPSELLTSAFRLISSSLPARWYELFLFSADGLALSPAGSWDSLKGSLSTSLCTTAPGVSQRVAETGESETGIGTIGEWMGSSPCPADVQVSGACVPIDDEGRLIGALSIARDDSTPFQPRELDLAILAGRHLAFCLREAELRHRAAEMANTDGLTGLHNYRYFIQCLGSEVERAARYRHPLSLLMLDMDDLKEYNDLFGHPQGNAALCQLAETIKGAVRRIDIVARYGGDEFAVIMPETDRSRALQAALRIIDAVSAQPTLTAPSGVPTRPLSVSAGLSSFPDLARDEDDLVCQADDALYHAKRDPARSIHVWRAPGPDDPGSAVR